MRVVDQTLNVLEHLQPHSKPQSISKSKNRHKVLQH